jgi:hypothetical protein
MTIPNELLNRAKQEYLEMPGLMLTTWQASRLWHLDIGTCQALLSTLVREEFLAETRDGAFLRRASGRVRTVCRMPRTSANETAQIRTGTA